VARELKPIKIINATRPSISISQRSIAGRSNVWIEREVDNFVVMEVFRRRVSGRLY
jgi:hypothetical protein